ncbi:CoB--CoM heterodisulfide reductase iron-sulfur subunit A family protein [Dethiobacter alkaliphilus]|uniref:4Fe-4S ferredoxin iron-sulfur binding domain protein n=1 Tax=Dethiobacter alkaliphilus AHT 1 TaxID=555088 RepID=C0GIK2_DETAL|nr:CoB--CoM heterodisulfide reductase iron-sulfur subunit A family protein [Dethiobacter alkaliphilus]EEG76863.1 4Fe-4S ferredoxin iron-sulfur binding domain protein [Dethiobacter alkaliphilus AHT 1]
MKRIGVFICWCGSNIAATVDIDKTVAAARTMPGVVHADHNKYTCSEMGQDMIKDAIKEHKLDRVVIGSCSPRMHENTFRKTVEAAGLNPFYMEIANIREQCSWVHKDKETSTDKAISLVRTAVAKAARNEALHADEMPVEKRALVIGGGIAGIQAALDIAESGFEVDLVEREPSIGGRMAQLDKTFPTLDCSACILTPKMVDAAQHEKINLITYSEVDKVEGFVGNFDVTIRNKARSVDMNKCTGCGDCMAKCPAKVESEFEEGLAQRRAIYTPFAQAVPNKPALDRANCRWFTSGKCKVCQKICPADAIDYDQEDQLVTNKYGAIVVSTGFDTHSLDNYGEYAYGKHPDVITSLEMERLFNASGPTGGKILRPSNGEPPKNVAFIQCVGSRDREKGNPYCAKVCCMYTAKHAILLSEKVPGAKAHVFYIDVRTPGKDYEEFYNRAYEEYGTSYIKGNVSKVFPDGDKLIVRSVDALSGALVELVVDMVVLATSVDARSDAKELGQKLSITTNAHNFFNEAHPKLRPVDTQTAGVFLAGMCQGPKDIPETVAQASAAAVKVASLLNKDNLMSNPTVAEVNLKYCNGDMSCMAVCPYGAISEKVIEERRGRETVKRKIAEVNTALCQGCGACTVACRPGAINLKGFTNEQILAEVDAICL